MRLNKVILIITLVLVSLVSVSLLLKVSAIIVSPPLLDVNVGRGDVFQGKFTVFFKQEDPSTFYLYLKKVKYIGDEPSLDLIDAEQGENTLANWIALDSTILYKPAVIGAENSDNAVDVTYTVSVPVNAPAGSHYAAIVVSQAPPTLDGKQSQVGIGGEVVYQILVNLNEEKINKTSLDFFKIKNNQKLFGHLPVEFETGFVNNGNVHAIPAANIEIFKGGDKIANIEMNVNRNRVFPGNTKVFENIWSEEKIEEMTDPDQIVKEREKLPNSFIEHILYELKNFKIGQYKAEIQGFAGPNPPFKDSVTFWVFPYHLFAVIALLVLIILLVLKLKFKSKKKTKRK